REMTISAGGVRSVALSINRSVEAEGYRNTPSYGTWSGMIKRLRRALPLALLHVMLLLAPAGGALAEPLRVVALGDSLTAGYGLPQEAAFPVVLEKALRERGMEVEIANAGVSGD